MRLLPILAAMLLLVSCAQQEAEQETQSSDGLPYKSLKVANFEPQWWHNTIFYEIWPRSFLDTDGDGSGDFNGIIEKLDYLEEIGANGLWLTPVFEAPSYHGYDFNDFYAVEKDYGTMEDFDRLIEECHERGIKVVLDLVINHISKDHEWFKKSAAREPGYEDFFIWRDNIPDGWGKPWATEPKPNWVWHWDDIRKQYYYGAFAASQPDVNLENPRVIEEMNKMAEFWLKRGVDGFRLDAVRYAIEDGPIPLQADTEGTMEYWAQFTQFVKSVNPDAMLVGEAWTSLENVARYRSGGKGLDSSFDFDFGYVVTSLLNPDAALAADFGTMSTENLTHTREDLWQNLLGRLEFAPLHYYSPFLTNHDQDRVMFTLDNDINKAKIAASLLWTTPGPLYLYYGEEIGMTQYKPSDDEFRRAIMQWKEDETAGFSENKDIWMDDPAWFPWRENYQGWWAGYWDKLRGTGASVEAQENDPDSILNHYKRLIYSRNNSSALQFPKEIRYYPVDNEDIWLATYHNGKSETRVIVNLNPRGPSIFTVPETLRGEFKDLLSGEKVKLGNRFTMSAAQTLLF